MIERVEFRNGVSETQATQSSPAASINDHSHISQHEVLIHNTSQIGELQWTGAMNAFRLARVFEAQRPDPLRSELELAHSPTLIPHETVPAKLEPNLVQPISDLAENANYTNAVHDRNARDFAAEIDGNTIAGLASEASPTASIRETKTSRMIDRTTGENSRRPVVFRGRLVRVGKTSQFVERLPT